MAELGLWNSHVAQTGSHHVYSRGRAGVQRSTSVVSQSWLGVVKLAVAIGIAYFLAAWLGLALRTNPAGVAFFWPAAGVAVGALVVLGPSAWLPGAIAVASASIATNLLIGRNTWLVFIFAIVNVAQAL